MENVGKRCMQHVLVLSTVAIVQWFGVMVLLCEVITCCGYTSIPTGLVVGHTVLLGLLCQPCSMSLDPSISDWTVKMMSSEDQLLWMFLASKSPSYYVYVNQFLWKCTHICHFLFFSYCLNLNAFVRSFAALLLANTGHDVLAVFDCGKGNFRFYFGRLCQEVATYVQLDVSYLPTECWF